MIRGSIDAFRTGQWWHSLIWNLSTVAFIITIATAASSCYKSSDKRINGTETHFLKWCDDGCDDGCGDELRCISGICTRKCDSDKDSCKELSPAAICTSKGVSDGDLAVCDVPCKSTAECLKVDEQLVCVDQFCRGPQLELDADIDTSDGLDASRDESSVQLQSNGDGEIIESRDRITISNKICFGGLDAWCNEESCELCNTDTRCGVGCVDCTLDGRICNINGTQCVRNTPYCYQNPCWLIPPSEQTLCRDADENALDPCPGTAGSDTCSTTAFCGQDAQYPGTVLTVPIRYPLRRIWSIFVV